MNETNIKILTLALSSRNAQATVKRVTLYSHVFYKLYRVLKRKRQFVKISLDKHEGFEVFQDAYISRQIVESRCKQENYRI